MSPNPPIHNHPTTYFTVGQPAISPHTDKTQLTVADVQRYVLTQPFPAGSTVKGVQPGIVLLKLMTSRDASIQMRGENVGLPDNAYVYYVIVKGPFYMKYISSASGSKNASTFSLGEEVFDAQTGNLLVWGIRE